MAAKKKKKKNKQTNAQRVVDVKKESDAMRLKLVNFKGVPELKPRCRPRDIERHNKHPHETILETMSKIFPRGG
jgi:hypothetical protein